MDIGVHRHAVLGTVMAHWPAQQVVHKGLLMEGMEIDITTKPRIWLQAVLRLMMRPASHTMTMRGGLAVLWRCNTILLNVHH